MTIHPPRYLWTLDATRYSERVMSLSEAGLRERICSALQRSGCFATETRPTILGVADSLEGHADRAWAARFRVNLSALGFWRVLIKRAIVAPSDDMSIVDDATLATLDEVCGFYVQNTLLAPAALLSDGWPGQCEWFIEADEPKPEFMPSVYPPVLATLATRIGKYLRRPAGSFALHVLGPDGGPLNQLTGGDTHGSFLVQALTPAAK